MKIFKLPDLGEGLQEAEVVSWHVKEGDAVQTDQPLVSVETAKAIVEIPAPYSGRIEKLFHRPGDIVPTDAPLVGFEGKEEEKGTVVGKMQVGTEVMVEQPVAVSRGPATVKATPAVRALAHRVNVELAMVSPTGPDGAITAADVQRAASEYAALAAPEPLRGVRRAMAQNMAYARSEVAPATIMDDADIHAWPAGTDVTIRLVRATGTACRAEPSLNAWFDSKSMSRRVMKIVDLGIAVDTPDGLFVPVLRDVVNRDAADLRRGLDRMRADVRARKIPPEELRGYTIILSNFGMIGGKYAAPVVMPPTVAILGAGTIYEAVVPENGAPAVHRIVPLSLTFDHRAVTGGEAGRFLAAVAADLRRSS
ncbi:MAG: branched-chain alpha-keto acid dehydrogenase subunit E2 [Betaproteobacteria bacterium RIFCSPLOWO2_02_FULL_65_24]|nr:MAG: branched-chain alpha-keto acid dehydrogenase subunit E2 [Betaproteobacteria bacterium RIFCSPLOWO2_02_FULL_65_24]OGA77280.1 MAG: branched-chain alpha-keto acid dehydrogenase subunit E2 [Betaproteobacteria bacterium RIFCSPLOWO2_12_FULL_66_14]